jgi:hypothetical protein
MYIALSVVLKFHVCSVLKPLHLAVYIIFLPNVPPVISVLLPHRFFVMPRLLSSTVLIIYLCSLKCSLHIYFILFSTSLFIVTWNLIFYAHFCKLWEAPISLIMSVSLHISTRLPNGFGGLGVSVLASGTQVRRFKPGQSRLIFKGGKILSMPSFGREVKP